MMPQPGDREWELFRRAALAAAVAHIRWYVGDDAALMAWCRDLVAARQLGLFEEA